MKASGILRCLAISVALLNLNSAYAEDWSVSGVHVTQIEASYLPGMIALQFDQQVGTCAAPGGWVWYKAGLAQAATGSTTVDYETGVLAVYAGLMKTMSRGKAVGISGFNSGCYITHIYFAP